MQNSSSLAHIAPAIVAAQAAMKGAKRDSLNPHFKNTYADLESVWDACREALGTNGLAVLQTTAIENNEPVLITTLIHTSGEWLSGTYPLRPSKADPQGYLAAMTYARRGCLAAMVGVVQVDDDGNTAAGHATQPQRIPVKPEAKPEAKAEPVKISALRQSVNEELVRKFGDVRESFNQLCIRGGLIRSGEDMFQLALPDAQRALSKAETIRQTLAGGGQ
jgi:hypothetical protein